MAPGKWKYRTSRSPLSSSPQVIFAFSGNPDRMVNAVLVQQNISFLNKIM